VRLLDMVLGLVVTFICSCTAYVDLPWRDPENMFSLVRDHVKPGSMTSKKTVDAEVLDVFMTLCASGSRRQAPSTMLPCLFSAVKNHLSHQLSQLLIDFNSLFYAKCVLVPPYT
jgi:hypothetical protein